MKLLASVLGALSAAGALASPMAQSESTRCIGKDRGGLPGSWVYYGCPPYIFAPGALCRMVPGNYTRGYPHCCPKPLCKGWPGWTDEDEMHIMG
ncbi:hypothetical protein IF1G_10770 [Cordyceps javanica]|uniref:Single domain-containing protein n=1 Tax=Cordyceps javanica TaxID=43265 RepID=A0A545VK32_9HYPO|nr:hypothetical protein IF1G_10770 [Cordyceps javanica]TQW02064.1 single domain von willebrand factor type C domain-containing protein [Cordyceps javanica]